MARNSKEHCEQKSKDVGAKVDGVIKMDHLIKVVTPIILKISPKSLLISLVNISL